MPSLSRELAVEPMSRESTLEPANEASEPTDESTSSLTLIQPTADLVILEDVSDTETMVSPRRRASASDSPGDEAARGRTRCSSAE